MTAGYLTTIHDDRQGKTCRAVLRKVLDNRWVLDDQLIHDNR